MNNESFAALAQLLRLRSGPSMEAARLVLVDGRTQAEAQVATGISAPGVSMAVARCRSGIELAMAIVSGIDRTNGSSDRAG